MGARAVGRDGAARRVLAARAARAGVAAAVVAGLTAGCGPSDDVTAAPATPAASTAAPSADAPSAGATPVVPDAESVLRDGAPLADAARPGHDAGSLLPVDGGDLQVVDQGDGSVAVTVQGAPGTLAWVAPPSGGRGEVQSDGSLTLHDEAGTVVAALAAPVAADGTRAAWRPSGDVVALDGPTGSASFVVGTVPLEGATWGENEGGRSLAVVPRPWVRDGGLAAQQALASQLSATEPEAASPSMQAQLWCHVLGARDKASWNLEPWRPEVPTTTLLATRCNPTDDDA
ncbi:DUF2599 domain-containing protein [Cellulomonas wangleii]|uniref:DUF2599 domain-containing protein n=1 Tax=Cellulomonas wangleii TaxID=2816956 RepID=UPI0027DB4955|nr:DUF2599 domain-containing protein [Cellulomonas wangleii]